MPENCDRLEGEGSMPICTLNDLFLHTTTTIPKPNLLMHKVRGAYSPLSTQEVRQAVEELAHGLVALGLSRGDRIALLSENRPGWAISDYAILAMGAVNVPIYPTLPPAQIQYILEDSEARAIIVSTSTQLEKVRTLLEALPSLQWVIPLDDVSMEGDRIRSYSSVCALGRETRRQDPALFVRLCNAAKPEDLATLIYTSGTTGNPKGVMLSHKNIVSNILACGNLIEMTPEDVALCLLPLCHIYERMIDYLVFFRGVTIAYAESIDAVGANLMEVRPTFMASVPRLYEKMYMRLQERAASASSLQKKIFDWAVATGREWAKQKLGKKPVGGWLGTKQRLADRLVLSKFRARTGGRIRFFLSGGAPLARELGEFFYGAGLLILEGYGLTETSPVITFNRYGRFKFGTVGEPVSGVEVRIAEDGEILTRSDSVMMGYYHRPRETAEALTDGWFHTGDIGVLDAEGFLRITDRKKDLIVTSGGKNVAPQNIENQLKTCSVVQNVIVVGNRRNYVTALVVPAFERIETYARSASISFQSREDLVKNPQIVDYVLKEINTATPELASFERIKKIVLVASDFTVESGELTPTMKVKRNVVEARYKELIDQLYG
jgi:long-chain acyl-CoA synthetase